VWLLIKNLAFTILVPGTVAVFVPLTMLSHPPEVPTTAPLALLMLFVGGAIYAWCLWDFAITGRGTPAPIDPPKRLVVRGLYRYSRNPMYVGVLFVIFGWAALFQSTAIALYGLCVWAGFQLFVLLYEEPHLRKVFGDAYTRYCSSVGRWLTIPINRFN
jgi:protein-S-isoprenylcysteine O-methyltransferase Ste14